MSNSSKKGFGVFEKKAHPGTWISMNPLPCLCGETSK